MRSNRWELVRAAKDTAGEVAQRFQHFPRRGHKFGSKHHVCNSSSRTLDSSTDSLSSNNVLKSLHPITTKTKEKNSYEDSKKLPHTVLRLHLKNSKFGLINSQQYQFLFNCIKYVK